MSTPLTAKKIEATRKRAARSKENVYGLKPLSRPSLHEVYDESLSINFAVDRHHTRYRVFKATSKPYLPPLVKQPPINVTTYEYEVDPATVICFSGRGSFLSSQYPAAIKVNGHVYPTVEHYYQACKLYQLSGPKLASELRSIREAGQAKVISRKLLREAGVSLHKIEEWKYHEAPLLLHHALVHKFVQHSDLSDMLVQTGNAILAHSYDHENTFATGCGTHEVLDWAKRNSGRIIQVPTRISHETIAYVPVVGKGKNLLGFLSMKVREQLLHLLQTKADPAVPDALKTLRLDDTF